MPASLPTIDATRLRLIDGQHAPPGSLLVTGAEYPAEPHLAFRDPREGQSPRPYLLGLFDAGRFGFSAEHAGRMGSHWLAVDRWRLRVDPATAFMGTTGMPLPGDAFISNGQAGIVGSFNHNTIYVSVVGEMLPEPNWGGGFVAFRDWSIVTDGDITGVEHQLLSRQRVDPRA